MPEIDHFINHATEVAVLVEDDFLARNNPHNSTKSGKLVSAESFNWTDMEIVELPLIEQNSLQDRPQNSSDTQQLLAR